MVKPRSILLFLLILSVQTGLRAQGGYNPDDPRPFNGGLILGLNFSQVDGDSYYGYHKVGINTGGVVYVHFTPVWGASMELLYTRKGSQAETVTESQALGEYVSKYFMGLNYVEVPVTLHYYYHSFDMEAGLSYARLISSTEYTTIDPPVIIDPIANRFNTSDLDYIFGLSRKLYKNLYINGRFQYSITSIRPWERIPFGYSYGQSGQYNNLVSFRFIYMF